MSNSIYKYILAILVLVYGWDTLTPALAQESSVVSAILEEAAGDLTALDEMVAEHESLLNKYPTSEFAPTLMFQLAELYYERSQLVFQQEMALFEKELAKFQNGQRSDEPALPSLRMDKTIIYCTALIEKYPQVKYRDRVIYKLAVAYMDEGEMEKSKANFELLAQEFPTSPMALEAHFRIGEYFFDNRQFEAAIARYKLLLNHWDNPYYSMALYKLGWSHYNLTNYTEAISTFLALIEDVSLVDSLATLKGALSKMDLRTESIHYIASSFTEYGGPALAKSFIGPIKDKEYAPAIFVKMAELYETRDTYAEAIAAYRVLLELYPFHQEAPQIFTRIVEDYEAVNDIEAANTVREETVAYFGPGSLWAKNYPQGDLHTAGLNIAKESLVYVGTFFQAQAQQAEKPELFQKAIAKYQEYISNFPQEKNTSEIHYYLAECFYAAGQYAHAADAYYEVVTQYPKSDYREKAAFNRIFSYVQLRQPGDKARQDTLVIANFLATADTVAIPVANAADKNVLIACNDFCRSFPASAWRDQVFMKYGELLNELGDYRRAVAAYKKVLEINPPSQYKLAAAMNAGQSYFDGEMYDEAQKWFGAIPQAFPDSTEQVRRAGRMVASSQFKIAELLSTGGHSSQAAAVLLNVASSSQDAVFQERALFEAATQLQKSDSLLDAARTFEQLVTRFPNSELGDKALYQAGSIRETLSDWPLAAANYINLFEKFAASPLREQALKNAALCYENASDWVAALLAYRRYVETYPDNYVDVLEYTFKAGDMAFRANQPEEAKWYFEQAVRIYNQRLLAGESLDNYFVAQAQFMIGEILYADYVKLNLMPPFEKNLKTKVAAFTGVVKAYTESIKYQIADWSTASSHRIGQCFEEFVRAFVQAPVPESLDAAQQQLYKDTLAEKARPYKEKALETYLKNVEQAEANGIDNSWVSQSRARAQVLQQELQFGGQVDMSAIEGS